MTRRILTCFVIATLVLVIAAAPGVAASQGTSQYPTQDPQARAPQPPQVRTVTGTIRSVSDEAFSIEVGQGANKQTIQFMTDANTTKSGELKVGSTATVQYRAGAGGQYMATRIEVES
jgi:hypothetical protein